MTREIKDARITVRFTLNEDNLNLEITDNGVGILASTGIKSEHQSLATKITKERIELLKRSLKKEINFSVKPLEKGSGTAVFFLLPFKYVWDV